MAAGRRLAVVVAAAALTPLLAVAVAGGSDDDDCFANCFKNCVGSDKSMTDYCNYACGMTCIPDHDDAPLHQLGLAGVPPTDCQLACVRTACRRGLRRQDGNKEMVACYGQCHDSCDTAGTKAALLPRPLRAATGGAARRSAALLRDKPFRKTPDAAAVRPAGEPDPDDAIRPALGPVHPPLL